MKPRERFKKALERNGETVQRGLWFSKKGKTVVSALFNQILQVYDVASLVDSLSKHDRFITESWSAHYKNTVILAPSPTLKLSASAEGDREQKAGSSVPNDIIVQKPPTR